ncbi:hypothetical protein CONPUDRAFT_119164 [Coniophora puteana RWD-64-598 SS2]|uniref:Uncharacterized protein n=1 Tax=Coniophora puteana (strain RWD-64-598) TaxID=741705 RepID=A0A5M3MXH0_CONPW|nr:uncharacterized protein CONPUDRAFT_119164 [Coniophora puteana RWD-64-598 SS2]EIW83786.1 hypothetical protein CONPUDRAFT_119164 [Coniophora puteana RWD-64-598 SS2]
MVQMKRENPAVDDSTAGWEDISEGELNQSRLSQSRTSSSSTASPRTRRRRRTAGTKAAIHASEKESSRRLRSATPSPSYVAASPPAPASPVKPSLPRSRTLDISREDVVDSLGSGAYHTFHYVHDIVAPAIRAFRKPLSLFLFLWMLAWAVTRMSATIRTALSPLCILPGISSSSLCAPFPPQAYNGRGRKPGDNNSKPQRVDFPELMRMQEGTFEHLMDNAVGGAGLSLEVRKAELATGDLTILVRNSELKGRDVLGDLLETFVKDAKKTAKGLTRLGSKVGGAVDQVMAVNGYTMRTIQEAHANTPSPYSIRALMPSFGRAPPREKVLAAFTDAMDTLADAITRLIVEAEVSLADLSALEEDLSAIHAVVVRENGSVTRSKDELLAQLWTMLGANRREIRSHDDRLALLQGLGDYRRRALAHVVAALQTLQGMSEDMEDLRERVAAPEIVGGRIPLEVHMESIQSGLERLKEGRVKAKEREDEAIRRVLAIDE